jgi:hypothetical protein
MQVPDTFQVAMSHPEKVLLTFTSMFGNGYYGEGRDLLFGTKGTLIHGHGDSVEVIADGAKRGEAKPSSGGYKDFTTLHMQNFFDCVRSRSEPNCPFEMGFRTSIACRMAVDSYRRGTTVRWDPTTEDIV